MDTNPYIVGDEPTLEVEDEVSISARTHITRRFFRFVRIFAIFFMTLMMMEL